MRCNSNEVQRKLGAAITLRRLQTIAEEALSAATEKSVKEKRRSSEAKRRAFFFLAFRPSGVASECVCVFLCYFLRTRKESKFHSTFHPSIHRLSEEKFTPMR